MARKNGREGYSGASPQKRRTPQARKPKRPPVKRASGQPSQAVQEPKRIKKRRPRRNAHKSITVITFIVLSMYIGGYLLAFLNKPSIGIETVTYGSVEAPKSLNGLIIRDEYVAKSPMDGQPNYNYAEYDKVKKGAVVCSIRNADNANSIEMKIQDIDKNILEAQKNRSDLSAFQDDVNRIEKNIANTVDNYTYKFIDGNFSNVYYMKSQIETQMDLRNDIWLTENVQSIAALTQEKSQYEKQLADNVSSVTAQSGGILSLKVDGLEEKFTPEAMESVTKEDTKMNASSEFISKTKNVKAEDPVFKIVESNTWYMASYIPNDMITSWKEGDSVEITAVIDEEEKKLNVSIYKLTPGEKETFVLFQSVRNITDVVDARNISFTVETEESRGIKIPNSAIIEKTFLKIPASCIIESAGEEGVIKKGDKGDSFVKVSVSRRETEKKEEQETTYAYILQDFESLRVGDTILNGTGENAASYTISDVATYQGVYVVNSTIAKFTIIDIESQNTDYSIVRAAASGSGLKIYDNIVSDAKTVQEGEIVY